MMELPTIAQLEAAAASNTVDAWLLRIPGDAARSRLRQALAIDRRLTTEYPASLASCLLVRCAGDPVLDDLHARWTRELTERGQPWIAALRPLAIEHGLLAELHPDAGFACSEPSFESEEILALTSTAVPPAPRPQLRWLWERGDATFRAIAPRALPVQEYPRFQGGWGPQLLVRGPGAIPIPLPCPREGNASARMSRDGTRILVYGSLEDAIGGFVYVVDPATLAIERSATTRRPIGGVHECERPRAMLLDTHSDGLALWVDDRVHELPFTAKSACLSPSGARMATWSERKGLQLWAVDALLQGDSAPVEAGFPTCFDPSGDRLLTDRRLYDGRTGEPLADLAPMFGHYLEGGPARPWMHFAARYLISVHRKLQLWDARSGQSIKFYGDHSYPHWYSLAYDRDGTRFAALCKGRKHVAVWELPTGEQLAELTFNVAGNAVAMSPDGQMIGVQHGGELELRTIKGELVRHVVHALDPGAPSEYVPLNTLTLRFSRDGRRIARFAGGDGWRIWSLVDDRQPQHLRALHAIDGVADFAARPADWTLDTTSRTVFTHRPTGTQIAIPASGPWAFNPADPRILACEATHLALRAR